MGDRLTNIETLKVVGVYALIGILYIFFSDRLLALFVDDPAQITQLQTVKGMAYVLATAFLLYLLILRMEHRLHRHDQRYSSIFQTNPVPMWIYDLDTLTILQVNKAAERQYGYSRQEFLGMTIKELRPPEEVPALLEQLDSERQSERQANVTGPWRHRRKDGSLIWVTIQAHPVEFEGHAGEMVVALDITANVEARDSLRMSAAVFDNSHEGIMVSDADNRIVMVNPAFEKITGYSRDEVIGQNPSMLSSGKQDQAFYQQLWLSLEHEDHWQGEIWNRHKDGSIFPEYLSISTIKDRSGKIRNYIAIFSDRTAEKEAEARINFLARFDPLTNLPNRSSLLDDFERMMSAADDQAEELTVMALDLDRFKNINDGFGYQVGNRLLTEIAHRLKTQMDELSGSVYRQSGDEFFLLVSGHDIKKITRIAKNILACVSKPFVADDQEVSFTASMGIAMFPLNGREPEQLLERADSAVSLAKRAGRNTFRFYDDSSHTRSLEYMRIENGLRNAIGNNELSLHFQPLFDANSRHICAFESLVRWTHPEWGMVPPDQFIPVAEESGQIVEIGKWILRTAFEQAQSWQRDFELAVPLAVNISVVQFRRADDLYNLLVELFAASSLPPALICLEITESIAMEDNTFTKDAIDRLHALGISIAIDDFGSGYSSLNYLKQLRVDKVKIDQGFVRDMGEDPRDVAILRSAIDMAHSLGFRTVAEGVETLEQYEQLREIGCDEIQGYYFARPMPANECETLLN